MQQPLDPVMPFTFKRFVLLAGKNGRAFSKLNDSTPQRNDLLLLVRLGALPQKVIAMELGVTRPVISRIVDALEDLGLVKRTIPPEDRRLRIISITPKGEASLRILFENYVSDFGVGTLQAHAEGELMHEWELVFKAACVSTGFLSESDQRDLLLRVQPTVWNCVYYGDPKWDDERNPNRYDNWRQRAA